MWKSDNIKLGHFRVRERGQIFGTEGFEAHMGLYFSEGLTGLHPEAKATIEKITSVRGHQGTLGGLTVVIVMTEFTQTSKYMSQERERANGG